MVKEGGYKIENIYLGGYSGLDSNYGDSFTGYRAETAKIGISTDPRTANVLKEISDKLAPGQKTVELSLVSPEMLDIIPKQHLKEVNRLSKLTGVDVTVHGPLIDASGVSRQGFDETQREIAERKIIHAINRSHEINPNGNIPVTFHTANELPGARWTKTKEGEEFKNFMPVVNQETGQVTAVKREEKFYPHSKEKEIRTVEREVDSMNNTEWLNSLTSIEQYRKNADDLMAEPFAKLAPVIEKASKGEKIELTPEQRVAFNQLQRANIFLNNVESAFNSLYNKAYKYSDHLQKKKLQEISDKWMEGIEKMKESKNIFGLPFQKSQHLSNALSMMEGISAPEVFKPAEEYALEKSKVTFGNAAWESYKKYGDKSPIISIENPPAGFGLSRAEDMKVMIEGAREKFVENAVKNGMGKDAARREAEKLIGATWDVGHINQLRQFGFTGKDIIGEAKKIAPFVKHVHLSDNFGNENVEIPMGMGNVDLKEVMKELGEGGEKARKIVEAAHWWQHTQSSPVGVTLEALGSPLYSMNMGPYWNQSVGFQQGYFGGYGQFLPSINYETFGAGFSTLPAELGGQRAGGGGSRMSGRPME